MNAERPVVTGKTQRGIDASIGLAAVVTPNNSTDLPNGVTRALYVCAEGSLRVTLMDQADGEYVEYVTIHAGRHPMFVKRVWATNTTALLVAEY